MPNECGFLYSLKPDHLQCLEAKGNTIALLGYETAEFLSGSMSLEHIFHPDDHDICKLIFAKTLTNHPELHTFRIFKKNVTGQPLRGRL